jgi:hypothetical protein
MNSILRLVQYVRTTLPLMSVRPMKALIACASAFACVYAPSLYAQQITAAERTVLIALYNSTGGANWTDRTNWRNTGNTDFGAAGTECTWFGVYCNSTKDRVEQIYLPNNNLVGTLPALNTLASLTYINVEKNRLSGSLPALSGLSGLFYLIANDNQFAGTIPSLAGLSTLREFRVHNNRLTGSIPALTGLSSLRIATFYANQLTGSLPALTGLTALTFFRAGDNLLSGSIPAFPSLPALNTYSVRNNDLTGTIPEINSLTALKFFHVDRNLLTGTLPTLTGLSSLQSFDVSENQLTGNIPSLSGLTSLQYFYVFDNRLSGSMPALTGLNALVNLEVGGNRLTGALPATPSALRANGSGLCPNQFNRVANTPWDTATGVVPWYSECECRFDVNGDGPYTAEVDGVILLRYLMGIRGAPLTAGFTLTGDRTTASAVEAYLASQIYDVRGTTPTNPKATRDGMVITRYLRDAGATAMVSGTGIASADAAAVYERVKGWCGFQ